MKTYVIFFFFRQYAIVCFVFIITLNTIEISEIRDKEPLFCLEGLSAITAFFSMIDVIILKFTEQDYYDILLDIFQQSLYRGWLFSLHTPFS